jgi:WXG100 family type VII secretion target
MGEIHVQFESLQGGQQGIQATYRSLVSTLETLESDLQPLIHTWSGAAQTSYLQCKKQWDDAASSLSTVLNSIGTAVGQAHDNYQSAERAAQSNWS